MPLSALVLLRIVDENFQATVYTTVVKIEAEAPDLQRFSTALVLTGIDACCKCVENLIVARKQCVAVNGVVPLIDCGIKGTRRNQQALMHHRDRKINS